MFDGHDWMWGMHFGWWIFWIVVVIVLALLVTRGVPNRSTPPPPETPLDILRRRYAAGEISTEEYEERKARLEDTT